MRTRDSAYGQAGASAPHNTWSSSAATAATRSSRGVNDSPPPGSNDGTPGPTASSCSPAEVLERSKASGAPTDPRDMVRATWAGGPDGGTVADDRQPVRAVATFAAGAVIGAVEVVLAVSFAALVFGGYLA